jgi:type II secretion system protein J
MNTRRQNRPTGFTIIEIMVALAILGLIVAAVYSSWMAVVRGAQAGRRAAAAAQRSRIAVRTLELSLSCARAFASDITNYAFVAVNGDEPMLSFVAKLPASFPRSGRFGDFDVRRVTFSLEAGPDSAKQLVLRQNPIQTGMDIDEQEHPIVLAPNVKDFKMQFWDGQSQDLLDEWTQTNMLPREVEIVLDLGGGGPQSYQPPQELAFIIAPASQMVQPMWQGVAGPMGRPGFNGPPVRPGIPPQPVTPQQPGMPPRAGPQ